MPEQDDKFKEFFGTGDPDKVLKEVQETLSADKAFIQEEMSEIKSLASGNKALNAIQIFDAYVRRKDDDKLEKAVSGMNASTDIISKDSHGAKKGRQDIREDITNTEIRLTKEIRAAGGGGQIGGVTQKLNKAGDTRGMHPNSQATQFKPQAGGTTEIANSIKLGLMPSRIGILKEAGGASRALGSLTKNITTDEGILDSAKVERLQEVLQDEKVKEDFNKYVSVLRSVTEKGEISEGQKKDLASTSDRLQGKGLDDVLGKQFLNYKQGRINMGGVKQFMGIDQGGFNLFDTFRLRNFTKKDGIIQKIAGTQNRVDSEKAELTAWSTNLKDAMIESNLRKSKQGRDAKREAMLGGVSNEGSVFGGRAGIDDEGGAVVKKLDQIEENTRALSGSGGSGGAGSILGTLGLILAAIYLWNRSPEDIVDGVTESPTTAKRITMAGKWLWDKGKTAVTTTRNAGFKVADIFRKGYSALKPGTVTPTVTTTKPPTVIGVDADGNKIVTSAGGDARIQGVDGNATTRAPVGDVKPTSFADELAESTVKNSGKPAAKSTPFLGAGIGAVAALYRGLWHGDMEGATAEVLSGAASFGAGPGTVASAGMDVGLLGYDIHRNPLERAKEDEKFTKRVAFRKSLLEQDDAYWSTPTGLDSAQRILQFEGDDMRKEDVQYLIDMLQKGGRELTGGMMPLSKTSIGKALEVEGLTGLDHIENYTLATASAIENSNEQLAMVEQSMNNLNTIPDRISEIVVTAQKRDTGPIAAIIPAGVTPNNHAFQRFMDSIAGVGWYGGR